MFEIIGFVMIQVFLFAIGAAGGAVCVLFASRAIRSVPASPRKLFAQATAFLFPVVTLYYLETGLLVDDYVRYAAGNDSSIFGGTFHYSLGNGYQLKFFEALDDAWVEVPGRGSLPPTRIYDLQVAGDFLFMHTAPKESQPGGTATITVIHGDPLRPTGTPGKPDQYLEVNTKTSETIDHGTLEDLRLAAAKRNVSLQLEPLEEFWDDARSAAAPGLVFWAVLLTPPLIVAAYLLRRLRDLRTLHLQAPSESAQSS